MRSRHLRVLLQLIAIAALAVLAAVPRTASTGQGTLPTATVAGASAVPSAASTASLPSTPSAPGPQPTPLPTQQPTPTPAPTARPASSPSPSPTNPPAARFGFAEKGMTGEMMAFVTGSQLEYARDHVDLDVVSTLAFSSLTATADGTLDTSGTDWDRWNSRTMDQVIARAHAAGTRVVLSVTRFAWTAADASATDHLLSSAARREHLAETIAAEVTGRGADGVNLDFVPIPTGRRAEFTDLVRRLRAALDRADTRYQLTVDVPEAFESYDVAGLVQPGAADALYLMGYDYAGAWSTTAGSIAPYGGAKPTVEQTVEGLLRLVRPDQLIVGVPYYGHLWPTVDSTVHARTTGPGSSVSYVDAISEARSHGLRFDPVQHTAWTAWQSPACAGCGLTWVQLYFDDARSLEWKWAEIRRWNVLGSGVWTIAFEGGPADLDRSMRKAFLAR